MNKCWKCNMNIRHLTKVGNKKHITCPACGKLLFRNIDKACKWLRGESK